MLFVLACGIVEEYYLSPEPIVFAAKLSRNVVKATKRSSWVSLYFLI